MDATETFDFASISLTGVSLDGPYLYADPARIRADMAARALEVAQALLPGGQRDGEAWVAPSPFTPGSQLRVIVEGPEVGRWRDGEGCPGGDLLGLSTGLNIVRWGAKLDTEADLEALRHEAQEVAMHDAIACEWSGWSVDEGKEVSAPEEALVAPLPDAAAPRPLLMWGEDLDNLPPFEWLVEGMVPRHGLACLSGQPGAGKSFVALDLAMRVATGQDFFGREVQQGRVLFIAGEGLNGIGKRRRAWEVTYNGGLPVGSGFVICRQPMPFDQAGGPDLPEVLRQLEKELKANIAAHGPIALVVVDTLAACMTAQENDTDAMMRFLRGLQALTEAHGCAAFLLHHPSKAGSDAEGAGFFRGASALYGSLDVGLSLRRDKETGELVLNPNEKPAKDDEPSPMVGLRLVSVPLGHDPRGRAITSCVLELGTAPAHGGGSRKKAKAPTKAELLRPEVERLLVEKPMRVAEMLEALGHERDDQTQRNAVTKALKAMEAEGLVEQEGQTWQVKA